MRCASNSTGVSARYRALLEFACATASASNIEALLHTTSATLSGIISLRLIALVLLDEKPGMAGLHVLEIGGNRSVIEIYTAPPPKGTAAQLAIDEQRPVFLDEGKTAMERLPELTAVLRGDPIRNFYAFPVTTSRRRIGAFVAAAESGSFTEDDVQLLRSVASHLALALDSILSFEFAGEYQRDLVRDRDRLKLLLEINNHIVSRLEVNEFFREASASIRRFFGNDVTGFWILDEDSRRWNCAVLDFPSSRSAFASIDIDEVAGQRMERLRARTPLIETLADIERDFPKSVSAPLRAESMVCFAVVPLVAPRGLIAAMSLGSRRANAFSQADLDLLMQVATQIALALDNALTYGRLSASRNHLEDQRIYLESEIVSESGFEDIIGSSAALRNVLDQIPIVAPTDSTIIIHGETGTGKELVARAIHRLSSRSNNTFVRLNCAAIPSGLLESELFGYEKGAFTGALTQKRGRFELADQGSLFLDEIGDISIELQPKLLRAIQEHEFERLGSTRTTRVNVRLIAATHRDLHKMIREGTFREDLFYRLNVFPIEVPPLRARRDDIPLLVQYFVSRLCRRMRKSITTIPRATMDTLMSWDWPGNIRELENFIERAVILSQGDTLNAPLAELVGTKLRVTPVLSFRESERNVIITALKAANGKISGTNGAAERLSLKRSTLLNKMGRLGIAPNEYRG